MSGCAMISDMGEASAILGAATQAPPFATLDREPLRVSLAESARGDESEAVAALQHDAMLTVEEREGVSALARELSCEQVGAHALRC